MFVESAFFPESSGDMVVRLGLVKSASLTNVSVGGLGFWHDVGGVVFYLKFNQLVIIGLVGRKKFVKTKLSTQTRRKVENPDGKRGMKRDMEGVKDELPALPPNPSRQRCFSKGNP